MLTWQLEMVAIVAAAALGVMIVAILRLYARPALERAVVRAGTAVESGLVGGIVPSGARVFDGWSYRVDARFAGRVRIAVYPDVVAIAGPRVPGAVYWTWIWVQSLFLASAFPTAAAALLWLDWRWLVASVSAFVVSFLISIGGAGLWPGLGELTAEAPEGRFYVLEFPRDSVREIDIGKGWAKGGLDVILFPYVAGVNKMAGQRAVSFFAPDERGHEVRVAIQMFTEDAARELADLLSSAPSHSSAERPGRPPSC